MIKGSCGIIKIIRPLLIFLFFFGSYANAQWVQLGNKLVGTGGIGNSREGVVSISADGKTAIVGGEADNSGVGAAWIYTFDGVGFVQYGNKLTAPDHIGASSQGITVSISADGKTAVVGGQNDNTIGLNSQGAAWIYTFNGSDFVQADKLTGPEGWTEFGNEVCVSADGKIVIVGRAYWNYTFAASIYSFTGTNFTLLNTLTDPTGVGGSFNGMSIAISANNKTILVATSYPANATWVYTFNGNDFVLAGNKFGSGGGYTGSAVDISADGKVAIVGDVTDNSASVFTFNGSTFVQLGNKLIGTGNIGNSGQGYAVSISADGKTALVGGRSDNSTRGAAWIYTFDGNNFIQGGDKLIPNDYTSRPSTGTSVDLSADGKIAIIGGPVDSFGRGASWIFINTSLPCAIVSISGVSPDANACVNANVKLSVEASGGFLSYRWYKNSSFLEESYSSEYNIHLLNSSNTGNYFCVISNSCGSSATSSGINVALSPLLTVTGIVYPGPVCPGKLVTINGLGAASYTLSGSNMVGVGFIATTSGTYTITGTDVYGCINFGTVNITVNSLPVLSISGNNTICPGNYSNITASGANTYNWSNGSTLAGISVNPLSNTTYSVTGTDLNGCQAPASQLVSVTSIVNIPISGDLSICKGDSTALMALNVSSVTWFNNSTTTSLVIHPLVNNTTVSLTGITTQGCIGQGSATINVNDLPILTISGKTDICIGAIVLLSVSGAANYTWSNQSIEKVISISPQTTEILSVTGIDGNGCSNTQLLTVKVNNLPGVSLDLSAINNTCDTLSPIVLIGGSPTEGTYWYSNKSITNLNTSIAGDYFITYQYTDANGCVNTATGILTSIHCTVPGICERPIVPCYCTNTCPPRFRIYSGITPNGDGYNDTWIIDSLPANSKVTILDKWGNELYYSDNYLQDWDGTKDGKQLPPGVYYYMIEIGSDKKRFTGTVSVIR